MLKNTLSLFILCCVTMLAQADYQYKNYDWEAEPKLHELNEEEIAAKAVIIKDKRIFEYVYEGEKQDELYLYQTVHNIVRVNEDQAIEEFNKVFIPINNSDALKTLKARAISPDGKVTELNRENIKELENVRSWGAFKIFAIEGAEKGGELEYFYTVKMEEELYGREMYQSDTKVKEAIFQLTSPENLVFKAKSYNGFPAPEITEDKDYRYMTATMTDMPALLEEDYSTYRANLARVDFKLSANKSNPFAAQIYSWDMAAETFGRSLYTYDEKAKNLIGKLFKELKIKRMKNPDDIIKAIEHYVKNNISLEFGGGFEFAMVDKILENKYANEVGLARLYGALLKEAGLLHEAVITSDRYNARFDKDFECWNNFTEVIYHFPHSGKYLSPSAIEQRYGAPPYQTANNYGLFIKDGKYWEVKYIDMPKADAHLNLIDATIQFDEDFNVNLDLHHGWTGYRASTFRFAYKFQEMEFINSVLISGLEGAKVENVELQNESIDDTADETKEFGVTGDVKINTLVEKAGKSYLFKIGEVIGMQMELYQENERQNPVDMDYPTKYKRSLKFTIPEGYTLTGLEDIRIDEFQEAEGEKVTRFVSDYTIDGREVTVTADEYYEAISFPKEEYDEFRKVINAAADFNKVVVVFEKTEK